jgi:aspartate aminotransferase-like enzyme
MSGRFPPVPEGLPSGFAKPRLFAPGPTLGLPEARLAAFTAEWHHRTPSYEACQKEVVERLADLMGLDGPVYLLASSGTGGMEAAVVNTVGPGEEAIAIAAGKFGERWAEILDACGAVPHVIEVPYGSSATPEQVRQALKDHPNARALFLQASETSTGAAHELGAMGELVREVDDCLLVADVISWLGAAPLSADADGVDVLVGASQKALMVGPGVAWIGLGTRAVARLEANAGSGRYYFDLRRQSRQSEGRHAFTPPIDTVLALLAALRFVQEQVGAERFARNASRQAHAFRAGLTELGLSVLPEHPTPSLTTVALPDDLDGLALTRRLESAYGIKVAGGQGPLRGRVIRVAHMGYYDLLDTLGCLAALERALDDLGVSVPLGNGLAAAQHAARQFDIEHGDGDAGNTSRGSQ